ncbi:cell wall assembly regulator SMI1 [Streptomyces sp. TLI_55]|uniref:SMI1/KNR4 family protein n=1 Tax=Streptomyces sp. TLI_55 TaxID=1938861 RepID=UPI000BDCEC0E|nr:SMI1/KNR4 family protein [Streptomyces sp. TLI_55]SNX88441.1 cell wall assembly regulator SMI1 [Streptomyces sp. TLI_55]
MNVEIPPHVRQTVSQLGDGVPYALKVPAGRLADDPDLGEPSSLPGILNVMIDGDLFEDCPTLAVGYIREPDRIEIRFVTPASFAQPATDTAREPEQQGQERAVDPGVEAVTVREVADAWRRITGWLQTHAPVSHAAFRAGASSAAVAAVEGELGVRIPVELRALWLLTAGDDGAHGWGCLPGNQALMTLDAVRALYRMKMDAQVSRDALNSGRPEEERITVWNATWIPVIALGPSDGSSGLYLDAATGYLGRWSRYNEAPGDERDTLVTYLEEMADMLESPALAARDKPGLIGETLVWLSSIDPAQEKRWRSLTN